MPVKPWLMFDFPPSHKGSDHSVHLLNLQKITRTTVTNVFIGFIRKKGRHIKPVASVISKIDAW